MITKEELFGFFSIYLNSNCILYVVGTHDKPDYTMKYYAENALGGYVEGCVWLYEKSAEIRAYYNEETSNLCKKSINHFDLLEVINYINARVFLNCGDHSLFMPRMYLTADDCYDICLTTIVDYKIIETYTKETFEYTTNYCPELLNMLADPILNVITGDISAEEAIAQIDREILS